MPSLLVCNVGPNPHIYLNILTAFHNFATCSAYQYVSFFSVLSNTPSVCIAEHSCLYRTGDFARIMKGSLIYEGRTDSQVKVRGHRVDLSEVEQAVTAVTGVDKSVVLCYNPGEAEQVTHHMSLSILCELGHADSETHCCCRRC
jgi:non-ribosomal peptide synthetase component E (peptide arylation enzyme)